MQKKTKYLFSMSQQAIPRHFMGSRVLTCIVVALPPILIIIGTPLSLKRSRCVLCPCSLMAPEYTIHQCPSRLFASVRLMCQEIESTWFSKPGHPFSPGPTEKETECATQHMPGSPFPSKQDRRRLIS